MTNVLGGAFSPAPSPDGRRLAFTEYTARGYDIRVMELNVSERPATFDGTRQSSCINSRAEGWRGGEVSSGGTK